MREARDRATLGVIKIVTPRRRLTLGAAIDRSVIHGTLTAPTGDRRDFHGMTEPLGSSGKSLRPWPRHRVPTRTAVTNVTDLGGRTRGELQSDERAQAKLLRRAPLLPRTPSAHLPAVRDSRLRRRPTKHQQQADQQQGVDQMTTTSPSG